MISKGMKANEFLKELRGMLNKGYGDSACKVAESIVEGCKFNGGNPQHIKVKKLFIASEGETSRFGNRNVRLEATDRVKIKYPYDRTWLFFKAIPVDLYLKYFSKGSANGSLIAGFDLNTDRINMVMVDKFGRIRDVKTEWFPEVTSHGFPRSKAKIKRLEALARLLDYAYHHNVGVV
ncbi:MAG: transposase, partial [Desulfurococcales archaeon ex4484_42]